MIVEFRANPGTDCHPLRTEYGYSLVTSVSPGVSAPGFAYSQFRADSSKTGTMIHSFTLLQLRYYMAELILTNSMLSK